MSSDIRKELNCKIRLSFGFEVSALLWLQQLAEVLSHCKPFVGMCLLKTFVGGWTTSIRMHESTKRSCLFGCQDSSDELKHYILCSPLWQIACQALEVTDPFHLEERLCLTNASPDSGPVALSSFRALPHLPQQCQM